MNTAVQHLSVDAIYWSEMYINDDLLIIGNGAYKPQNSYYGYLRLLRSDDAISEFIV